MITSDPPVNRMTDRHNWKHYLPPTLLAGAKDGHRIGHINILFIDRSYSAAESSTDTFCHKILSGFVFSRQNMSMLVLILDSNSFRDILFGVVENSYRVIQIDCNFRSTKQIVQNK